MSFEDRKLHGDSSIFFLDVNRSNPKMSSTTNHRFYNTLDDFMVPEKMKKLSESCKK